MKQVWKLWFRSSKLTVASIRRLQPMLHGRKAAMAAAQYLATTHKIKLHLIKFNNRVDLGDILP
jgi:hypothetical protein